MLQRRFHGVAMALSPNCAHATAYDALIAGGTIAPLTGENAPLTQPQCDALLRMIDALRALNKVLAPNSLAYSFKAIPEPDLRVRPSL